MVGSSLSRCAAALAALVLLVGTASAADVVRLSDGGLLPGEVISLDDESVLFQRESGGEVRIPWQAVLPISRYELWGSTLAAHDRDGRESLATWALGASLYPQARRTLLEAQGLLPADASVDEATRLDRLLDDIAKREADAAIAAIDGQIQAAAPEEALAAARKYLRVAPPGAHADRVRARVPDLLVRIEQREEQVKDAREVAADARKRAAKQKKVDAQLTRAADKKTTAVDKQAAAYTHLAKGNQTRSKRALSAAERGFNDARELYVKTARLAGPGEIFELCKSEAKDCDRRLLDALRRWARLEVDNKAWKRASAVVDRAMRLDAVDTELLDMRREIDENWLRRKLSRLTNARGRESN